MAGRNLIYYPGASVDDLNAIASQPFTNVVLGQFHFSNTSGPTYGTLSWNDTAVSDVPADVWTAVQGLPQVVSFQLGSAGNGTWTYIANNIDAAAQTVVDFINGGYGVGGVDLDPEPIGAVPLDVILNFTIALGALQQSTPFYLSHVPVPWDNTYYPQLYGPANWPQISAFVSWITPQWYGSAGAELVTAYENFWNQGPDGPSPTEGPQPDILVAGQETGNTTLAQLVSAIQSLNTNYDSNWGGVGVWSYPTPDGTDDWSTAISKALSGS